MDQRLVHVGVIILLGALLLVGASDDRLVLGTAGLLAGLAAAGLVAWAWRGWTWLPAGLLALHLVGEGLSNLIVDECGIGWVPQIIQYVWLNYLSATRVLVPLALAFAAGFVRPHDPEAGVWGMVLALLFYAFNAQSAGFCHYALH